MRIRAPNAIGVPIHCLSELPETYSIARYGRPPASPTSYIADDVRVIESRGRPRLLEEPRRGLRGLFLLEDLERDATLEDVVVRAIDAPHPAAAEERFDDESADAISPLERHPPRISRFTYVHRARSLSPKHSFRERAPS